MCPRQGSNFLLLRQKKVTKEKATLFAGRPRADCSALLGLGGEGQKLATRPAATALKHLPQVRGRSALRAPPPSPALLDGSPRGPREGSPSASCHASLRIGAIKPMRQR